MTITTSTLTSAARTPVGNAVATASISPTANRVVIASCCYRGTDFFADNVFAVSGNGLTWNRLGEVRDGPIGTSARGLAVFWALTGSSPSAGAVTFTESDAASFNGDACLAVIEFSGTDLTSAAVGAGSEGSIGDATSLGALSIPGTPATGDITFCVFGSADNANDFTISPGTWSEILHTGPGPESQSYAYTNTAQNTTPSWSWTTVSSIGLAIGALIKATAAAADIVVGARALTNGLASLDTECDRIHVCAAGTIASYSDVTTLSLGNKNFGAGSAFGSPGAWASGRKVSSVAISDGSITASGTVAQWAAVDSVNSRLLAYGNLTGGTAVTSGQTFTLASFDVQLPNA